MDNIIHHIKMVIADYGTFGADTAYDSAVFLEGGSFDIGNIELPNDYLIADGTALCEGDDVILDSQLDPTLYDVKWYNGDNLIVGATSPALTVSQSGTYYIHASYIGTDCTTIDSIVVEYFLDADATVPNDLTLCDSSGQGIFNLTSTRDTILSPFPAGTHEVLYFLNEIDATNNNISEALTEAEAQAFLGVNGQQIYVRVNFLTTSCFQVISFKLIVDDLTPQFTLNGKMAICPQETTTITVVPTNGSFNPSLVTYEWTFNNDVIVGATGSSLTIIGQAGYGTYTVKVNNSGCWSTQTFEIVPSTEQWDVVLNGSATLCPTETGSLTASVTNNTQNAPVTYTFTLPNGTDVVTNNNVLPITATGVYTVSVDILGCISAPISFTVGNSTPDWQVAFIGEPYVICDGESTTLSFIASNFDIDNPNAVYTWTTPTGATSQGKTLSANQIGTYTLSVDIFGCISTFNVDVTANNLAIEIDFSQGCDNNSYRLEAVPFNSSFDVATSTFVWSGPNVIATADSNAIILGSNGTYTVTVTNAQGCSSTESVTVNNISCTIQKGISPNNDGDNDSFDLTALNVKELLIYNRYGTEVYQLKNYTDQWKGQSKSGKELPDGTYFYIIHTFAGEKMSGWIYINR